MTIERLRLLALYHAEQAARLAEAAGGLGACAAAAEFREKADWHRDTAEQLNELAHAFATFSALASARQRIPGGFRAGQ